MIRRKRPIALLIMLVLLASACTREAITYHNENLHNGAKIIQPYYAIKKSKVAMLALGLGLPAAAYFVGSAGGANPVGGYVAAGLTGTVSLFGVPSGMKHNVANKPVTKISNLDSWLANYNKNNTTEYVLIRPQSYKGYSYLVPKQNKSQFLIDEKMRLAKKEQEMREKNQRIIEGVLMGIGVLLEAGSKGRNRDNADRDHNGQVTCPNCGGNGLGSGYDEMNMRNKCSKCRGTGKVF